MTENVADFVLGLSILLVVKREGADGNGPKLLLLLLAGGRLVSVEFEEVFGLLLRDLGREYLFEKIDELLLFDYIRI